MPIRNSYDEHLQYDTNGNITSLNRNGGSDVSTSVIAIDNLSYLYDATKKNQLIKVTDATNNTEGFKDVDVAGTNDYGYDLNGNLLTDKNKGITSITYNHLNLPTKITISTTGVSGEISYLYNAAGVRLQKKVTDNATSPATVTTIDYLNGYQYKNTVLEFFPTTEGYVKNTIVNKVNNYNYVFNYTDHLGNVRLSYTLDPTDNVLKILEENHYYPFGLKHKGYNANQLMIRGQASSPPILVVPVVNPSDLTYKFRFNGKEQQDELGLNTYDFGARNYDPAIARWMNIDPLAEKSRRFSPYTYANNNPVYYIDPDGMDAESFDKSDFDFKVDIGYGRMVDYRRVGSAISFNHVDTNLNKKGQQKINNNAVEYLEQAGYKPDEKISEMDEDNREYYAKKMAKEVRPANLLYKDAGLFDNEGAKIIYYADLKDSEGGKDAGKFNIWTNKVELASAAFTTNLGLFFVIMHEGMHGWDSAHGVISNYGGDMTLYGKARAISETRAYQLEMWFGSKLSEFSQSLYNSFSKRAEIYVPGHSYEIKSFPAFFQTLQNRNK